MERTSGFDGATAREGDGEPLLTAQEQAALAVSATGLGVGDVAESLALPPDVVRRALASAAAKLGARSKLEAVLLALRRGLIDLPREPDAGLD